MINVVIGLAARCWADRRCLTRCCMFAAINATTIYGMHWVTRVGRTKKFYRTFESQKIREIRTWRLISDIMELVSFVLFSIVFQFYIKFNLFIVSPPFLFHFQKFHMAPNSTFLNVPFAILFHFSCGSTFN
jgi:hypothetical protein